MANWIGIIQCFGPALKRRPVQDKKSRGKVKLRWFSNKKQPSRARV